MNAVADKPPAFELRIGRDGSRRDPSAQRLALRATGDGWSLLGADGQVVFRGDGLAGRRQCLEFARGRGVLAVLSR
jgi:hypothetical protein